LASLSEHYQAQGVKWGIGLSPMGLSESYTANDRQLLINKIIQLNTLSPDILCILFDDIRGDIDGLAQRQLDVMEDVLSVSSAAKHAVCPTYYSFDPVLEKVFGNMPENYLSDLGEGLPNGVDIFWTGNQVISTGFEESDIQAAASLLKRKPLIWDNYPVNDGRLTSRFLHLRPYTGRPDTLSTWTAGHVVNPMNQPLLSQLVLSSLQSVYQQGESYSVSGALQDAMSLLSCDPLATQLMDDMVIFQDGGLDSLSKNDCAEKIQQYRAFRHAVADEVVDWLEGGYQFDPDCLTG
jgi:hypothetical protein